MIPAVLPVFPDLPGIRAFFTTRRGGESQGKFASLNLSFFSGDDPARVRNNWEKLLQSQRLADKRLAMPRLVHGTSCHEIPDPAEPLLAGTVAAAPEATDAIYTHNAHWVLAVTAGDCLAALIADPESHCIAAVHAGWRGSRDNILGRTLTHLFAAGHCRPDSTSIALGPCLSSAALEISQELAATLPQRHIAFQNDRFLFDLRACNRAQAEVAGADPHRISDAIGCTYAESDRFFSYRRDGAASGRMAACIAFCD